VDDNRLVPRDSAVYQEFARLYQLARTLRPTGADRWNGDLHATSTRRWGAFNPKTGAIRLSELDVMQYLTGSTFATSPRQQAQALATVLHETTHAGMEVDAPAEPNAVRSGHSEGVMEGFAELRTVEDFRAFTSRAGYPGLTLEEPQYRGAYAATESLMAQVAGPRLRREAIIDAGTQGPVVMHFDLLAEGVVRNRLGDVVPDRAGDRGAVRAALIETMKHEHWPTLPDRSARTGEAVAEDIRRGLNAKVDEIRRHYQAHPAHPFPAESPNAESTRAAVLEIPANADLISLPPPAADTRVDVPLSLTTMRFLSGPAPAAQAIRQAPSLADGSRGAGSPQVPGAARSTPSRPGPADRNRD
jgi:hypothetical protein